MWVSDNLVTYYFWMSMSHFCLPVLQTCICGKNSTEVKERSVNPKDHGCKGYWTMPPLPTVSKCGAQGHWLWTRPLNHGIDKSAKAGQSAEWSNASRTQNYQGHTHWDQVVHARPPTSSNQTQNGACQSILQCHQNSYQPTPQGCERHKGMQTGRVLDGPSICYW